MTNESYLEPVE